MAKGKRKDRITFVTRVSETPMTQAQLMASERMLATMVARLILEENQRECVESGEGTEKEPGPNGNSGKGSDDAQ